jgi:hypothetical protein
MRFMLFSPLGRISAARHISKWRAVEKRRHFKRF